MHFASGWGLPLVITVILACMPPAPMPSLSAAESTADEQGPVSPAQSGLRGEADGGTVWVVSDGIGTDVESAKLDAYRNAVRQAVGAYVDATTIVANDQLITDEVIALSGAFISKVEVLPGSEKKDGTFTRLRVKSQVETGKVLTALHKKNVPTRSERVVIDTDSIVAELATKEDRIGKAEKLLEKLLEGYPQKCFRVSIVGQPKPTKQEGDNVELLCRVRIETDVEAWQDFSRALREVLRAVAVSQEIVRICVDRRPQPDYPTVRNGFIESLLDAETLSVHREVIGQEASVTSTGKLGQCPEGGPGSFAWVSWPKEHCNVAVLCGDLMKGEDIAVEVFSVPLRIAGKLPRLQTKDGQMAAFPLHRNVGEGSMELPIRLVQPNLKNHMRAGDPSLARAVLWPAGAFSRESGLLGSHRGEPYWVTPCLFCCRGSAYVHELATSLECTLRFRLPASVLADRPEIRCICE